MEGQSRNKLILADGDGLCRILRVVEEVEELQPELHLDALRQLEVLVQGPVHGACAGPGADTNRGTSHLSQLEAVHGVGVRVEPPEPITEASAAGLTRNPHWTLGVPGASPADAGGIIDIIH